MSANLNAPAEFEQPDKAGIDREPGFSNADHKPGFSRPEPDVIHLDLDSGPNDAPSKSAWEHWRDDVLVYDGWPEAQEAELVLRLFDLRGIAGRSLDMAGEAGSPRATKANLKNVVAALKSAMVTIRALDRYRHGDRQRIVVDYGNAGLPPGKLMRDPRYTLSDATIDYTFGQLVGYLARFEDSCRRHAEVLGRFRPEELRRGLRNGHFQPDRRSWETQYLGLSAYLAGQVVKLRADLDRRYTRGQQHIVVQRRDRPRRGARKIPLMPADRADVPQGTEPVFAVAQGVKKASLEEAHAA
jgi:hypothetical protein